MGEAVLDETIRPTKVPNLLIVPASVELAGAELAMMDLERRQHRPKDAIHGRVSEFDHVLIDCPPSLPLPPGHAILAAQAGRGSRASRDRVCQYVSTSVGAVALKKQEVHSPTRIQLQKKN